MKKIVCVGLGYVGLPLAYNFAKYDIIKTIGFDLSVKKIEDLKNGIDVTNQVGPKIKESALELSSDPSVIKDADFVIIAVPTPTTDGVPDLNYIKGASELVGKNIKENTIVIFESTVFPHCTEEYAAPIIEKESGLKLNKDFFVGYSPERINPGDLNHSVDKMIKIVSGSTPEALEKISALYRIITPEVFPVESIPIAEAAKVLENSQRDVNIALLNQFAMIYPEVPINQVIDAMNTKWNSLGFRPGLVGGHCIAEDPYYLIDSSRKKGKRFTILEESRSINEELAYYIANKIEVSSVCQLVPKRILLCGITYKENVNDVRNTKLINVYNQLSSDCGVVEIYDPIANKEALWHDYGLKLVENPDFASYDVFVIGLKHDIFKNMLETIYEANKKRSHEIVLFDIPMLYAKDSLREKFIYRNL